VALWFDLNINAHTLGLVEIQRLDDLDLRDPEAIADKVCTYLVRFDHIDIGYVQHRYGDGAFRLAEIACGLLARTVERVHARPRFTERPDGKPSWYEGG
jgi:hypothetical protein